MGFGLSGLVGRWYASVAGVTRCVEVCELLHVDYVEGFDLQVK